MAIGFELNAEPVSVDIDPQTPLLEVLRNDIELNGPKFGCGLAQCGACTVLLDGVSVRACVLPVQLVAGKQVTTLEGLGNETNPHALQTAFIKHQALQCGYCVGGIITTAAALLEQNPAPSKDEIKSALAGHLCRCGAHARMVAAIEDAAKVMAGDES